MTKDLHYIGVIILFPLLVGIYLRLW